MAYSKLHSSLVNSSLWCERDDVRLLFITMLALADRNGDIFGSWGGIARQANIHWPPEEGSRDPFAILMEPDPDSSDILRNPENEGKRIQEIEGGFHIINYPFFRSLRNDDDRREQNRQAQARFRDRQQNKPESAAISPDKPMQRQRAEAEAKEKEKEKEMPASSFSSSFSKSKAKSKPVDQIPVYDKPGPTHDPTDEELANIHRINKEAKDKLAADLAKLRSA